jgi:hypothetical protein
MAVVAVVVHIHIAMDPRWVPVVKAVVQQGLAQTVAQHHRVQQIPAVEVAADHIGLYRLTVGTVELVDQALLYLKFQGFGLQHFLQD